MVHIVSILNLTDYKTQVNKQWINIILKELTKFNEGIRALFNITNQLATQVQVQNIILHLRAMLANLRDCLHFMKQLANHVLEYIDTATTAHPDTTSDTCTRPPADAILNRIRTTS